MHKFLKAFMFGAAMAVAGGASAQSVNVQVGVDNENPSRMERRMQRSMDMDEGAVRVERRSRMNDAMDDNEVVVERRRNRIERDVVVDDRRRMERRRDIDVVGAVLPVVTGRTVVERRVVRPARTRTVCNTVVKERIRPNGTLVRTSKPECRQIVTTRRVRIQ